MGLRNFDQVDDELITELLQQSMGLLAEWRVPLWQACVRVQAEVLGGASQLGLSMHPQQVGFPMINWGWMVGGYYHHLWIHPLKPRVFTGNSSGLAGSCICACSWASLLGHVEHVGLGFGCSSGCVTRHPGAFHLLVKGEWGPAIQTLQLYRCFVFFVYL